MRCMDRETDPEVEAIQSHGRPLNCGLSCI